jgi:hypothetical protein
MKSALDIAQSLRVAQHLLLDAIKATMRLELDGNDRDEAIAILTTVETEIHDARALLGDDEALLPF